MIDCCTYKCEQGRDCPVRAAREEQGEPLSLGETIYFYTVMAAGLMAYITTVLWLVL